MRPILLASLSCLAWACTPALSLAACGGADLLAALAHAEPRAVAAIQAKAEAVPNGEGRFWRIERTGVAPSHLFGTFHASVAIGSVPDAAWAALDGAAQAVFEIDPDEQAAIQARLATEPQMAFDPSAPPLSSLLDAESLGTVRTALTMRGVPGVLSEQMRPWMLFSLLSLPVCELQAALQGEKPLDDVMGRRAAGAGIPLSGLESFDDVMASFERIGPDALLAMLVGGRELMAMEEDVFRTTLDLYAAGRIAAIAAFHDWLARRHSGPAAAAAADAAMAELLDGRNAAWLPALERSLDGGNAFVAVGALHLPGERGLVALLRGRGWTVTRLD